MTHRAGAAPHRASVDWSVATVEVFNQGKVAHDDREVRQPGCVRPEGGALTSSSRAGERLARARRPSMAAVQSPWGRRRAAGIRRCRPRPSGRSLGWRSHPRWRRRQPGQDGAASKAGDGLNIAVGGANEGSIMVGQFRSQGNMAGLLQEGNHTWIVHFCKLLYTNICQCQARGEKISESELKRKGGTRISRAGTDEK